MTSQFGAGGLITSDIESVDLGSHHGVTLHGEVVRRRLQLGLGGRRGIRLELGRARPRSIRAEREGHTVRYPVHASADPWVSAAQRLLALTIVTSVVPWLIRRSRFVQRGDA